MDKVNYIKYNSMTLLSLEMMAVENVELFYNNLLLKNYKQKHKGCKSKPLVFTRGCHPCQGGNGDFYPNNMLT